MSNRPKASGRTAFGMPLSRAIAQLSPHDNRKVTQAITFGDPGCNVGGSGLRRLRFDDGRLRNRVEPKLYRQDGTRKN